MNLAFELPRDQGLRENNPFQPFKTVSLWEMLRFYARPFLQISATSADLTRIFHEFKKKYPAQDKIKINQEVLLKIRGGLSRIHDHLSHLRLNMSVKTSSKLITYLGQGNDEISLNEVVSSMEKLQERIEEELEDRELFLISADRAGFYRKGDRFLGKDLLSKFADLTEDANEAAACFAAARYTASAFHLMRIVEYIVHKFAENLDIPFNEEDDSWGQILDRVWQKIDKWPRGPIKKKYSSCYKLMDGMRPWRNDIMHHKEYYTQERLADLKGTVKSCMRDFLKLPDWKPLIESKSSELRLVTSDSETKD